MRNPPWSRTTDDAPRFRDRLLWVTVVVIALVFVGIGVRRDQIPVYSLEGNRDGRVFFAWPETCQQGATVSIVETSTSVTVTANHNRHFCGGVGACAESVRVELKDPLGSRTVFDGDRHLLIPVEDPE